MGIFFIKIFRIAAAYLPAMCWRNMCAIKRKKSLKTVKSNRTIFAAGLRIVFMGYQANNIVIKAREILILY